MRSKTSEEKTLLGESGGNALLLQVGLDYYRVLGRRSAEERRRRKALQVQLA